MTTDDRDLATRLGALATETSRAGVRLEQMDVPALVRAQLDADREIAGAVEAAADQITAALVVIEHRLENGGRMLYVGAGTPGRLAVLDAAECLPTFGVGTDVVDARIAGGDDAFTSAVEGAEDDHDAGGRDVRAAGIGASDVVVAISASGRTPYVLGAIEAARELGAATVGIANNPDSPLAAAVDLPIETLTGPELVTGSTRLKAGTAQKLVLNMISTATMVRLGKVYGNLMVDVRPSNEKLVARAERIVQAATDCDLETARRALAAADGHAKTAIVAVLCDIDAETARERLSAGAGFVREAVRPRG